MKYTMISVVWVSFLSTYHVCSNEDFSKVNQSFSITSNRTPTETIYRMTNHIKYYKCEMFLFKLVSLSVLHFWLYVICTCFILFLLGVVLGPLSLTKSLNPPVDMCCKFAFCYKHCGSEACALIHVAPSMLFHVRVQLTKWYQLKFCFTKHMGLLKGTSAGSWNYVVIFADSFKGPTQGSDPEFIQIFFHHLKR